MPAPDKPSRDFILFSLPFCSQGLLCKVWGIPEANVIDIHSVYANRTSVNNIARSNFGKDLVFLIRNPIDIVCRISSQGKVIPFFDDIKSYVLDFDKLSKDDKIAAYVSFWTREILYYNPRVIKTESFVNLKEFEKNRETIESATKALSDVCSQLGY